LQFAQCFQYHLMAQMARGAAQREVERHAKRVEHHAKGGEELLTTTSVASARMSSRGQDKASSTHRSRYLTEAQ
jgi:hypothetical protein